MATLLRMPEVAANATHATLAAWSKKEGEPIAVGDCLAEVETDKAIVEISADGAGVMGQWLVQAGQEVEVGAPIAVLLAAGEAAADVQALLQAAGAVAAAPAAGAAPAVSGTPAPAAAAAPAVGPAGGGRLRASPLARRLAAQRGVDLSRLQGSGPGGRIVRIDVERAQAVAPAPAPVAAPPAAAPAGPGRRAGGRQRLHRGAALQYAPHHRPAPGREQVHHPALLPHGGVPHGAPAGAARRDQRGGEPQDLGQRLHRARRGRGPARGAAGQRGLDRDRHAPVRAGRRGRGRVHRHRPHHAHRARGRPQDAVADQCRDRRPGRACPRRPAAPRGVPGRLVQREQPGHARRGRVLGHHQPAAGRHPGRGRVAAEAGGGERRTPGGHGDGLHAVGGPPRHRRRPGRAVAGRVPARHRGAALDADLK
ncbi:hypothetical protein CE154_017765 [Alicycliphilus denitrificans]|uniref:Dihydrolipoamide acetyltransferase component of pyruvate dehydrogenase complex n=1 Tax=Alicycliphilus denitrificans TaxID=179636 RepID=A0A3R7IEW3_9BURK|nr:hypothetical protein CE154_017765 [Alicycliphilus denitrificans]